MLYPGTLATQHDCLAVIVLLLVTPVHLKITERIEVPVQVVSKMVPE